MKVSEAMELISNIYIPGVVSYYENFKTDPWWSAHKNLERVMGMRDPGLTESVAQNFHDRCVELIERFKRDGKESEDIRPIDAMNMSVANVNAWYSRKHKSCFKCGSFKDLKIEALPNSVDVVLVCRECKAQ